MAFPYIFKSNFEAGTNAEWDSEADTGSKLDFPHFSTLAGFPGQGTPYRGAYCARINLRPGDTNDHTLTEGDIDIATGVERFFRWAMFLSNDFGATADDNFSIFELQQAGGTQVFVVGCTVTAATDDVTVWVAENSTPETTSSAALPKGRWFILEVQANVDTGAANGDITVYLDGVSIVSLATPVQNAAAVGTGVLGTQNTLSTTTGTMLFDDFVMDDARLYPPNERFPAVQRITKTGHVFVGPGWIESATILSATGTMSVYDTDSGNSNDAQAAVLELNSSGPFVSIDTPTYFKRGCYVVLAGTNPYGEVRLVGPGRERGIHGPICNSDGAIRRYGAARTPRPNNV